MTLDDFECIEFDFEGFPAEITLPKQRNKNPVLIIKTEYSGAFPEAEIKLLENGHYRAFIENSNRWGTDDDLDRKARFIKYVIEKYKLSPKCVPVGMSCGGLIAIKFAAKYSELVSCLYLDAPVVNYMSCPCGFGKGNPLSSDNSEILDALKLNTIGELMAYRDMPLDKIPELVKSKIPVILVAGDSDTTVPYDENGIFLARAYEKAGNEIEIYLKPGCNHHPHGLENPDIIANFVEKHLDV